MKFLLIALLLCGGVCQASTVIAHTWSVSTAVPDNSSTGWSDTRTIVSPEGSITDVQVHLKLSGGFNGDLYAYLAHESGFAILLNRPGRSAGNPDGSFTTGIDAVFSSAADLDAHHASGFTGTFQPDGRNVSPYLVTDTSPRTAMLTSFLGGDPAGDWTLFIADLSPLYQSTVLEWGIIITADVVAIPEPGPLAGIACMLLFALLKRRR